MMNRKNRSSSTFSNYARHSFGTGAPKTWDERQLELQQCLTDQDPHQPSLCVDALLDAIQAVYLDTKNSFASTGSTSNPRNSSTPNNSTNALHQGLAKFVKRYERVLNRIQTLKLNLNDFELIKPLAKGAFATVCLVRHLADKRLYALKILKKKMLQETREAAFFMEERNALVFASNSKWITSLFAAFQDENNLYLVMEYAPGGSLRSMTSVRDLTLTESEARFYVAEIILALEELHNLKFVHRDVKPENCLITSEGHIKLADFGSCIRMDDKDMATSIDAVGTPDYIPPEVLRAHEGKMSYGKECDWWSLGVILFELLHGETPFGGDSVPQVYSKIMNHHESLHFGEDLKLSENVKDLLSKLLTDKDKRLGRNGIDEIKSHPWFDSIDWINIDKSTPPFVPSLKSDVDTTYFEDEDVGDFKPPNTKQTSKSEKPFNGSHMPFIGYSFHSKVHPKIVFQTTADGAVLPAESRVSILTNVLETTSLKQESHSFSNNASLDYSTQFTKESATTEKLTITTRKSSIVSQTQQTVPFASATPNTDSPIPQSPCSLKEYVQKKTMIKSLQQKLLLANDLKELSQAQLSVTLSKVDNLNVQLEASSRQVALLEKDLETARALNKILEAQLCQIQQTHGINESFVNSVNIEN